MNNLTAMSRKTALSGQTAVKGLSLLKRDSLSEGGFAGLREHQLIKNPGVFGTSANRDGSWPGIGNLVYLADARFMPHGETHLHDHHEIDVISVMVEGRLAHQGSMGAGQELSKNDVQIQRAGGEGFSHNEINPDADWNRMIQIWVRPEQAGQSADYEVVHPVVGGVTSIYGGNASSRFPAATRIQIVLLETAQELVLDEPFLAYLTRGSGINSDSGEQRLFDGDLFSGDSLNFSALEPVQLIIMTHKPG